MPEVTVEIEETGQRLDAFLALALPDVTRNRLQQLLEAGCVRMADGSIPKKNRKVASGERYTVTLPEASPVELLAEDLPLDIVYEDAELIVLNKPKDMVVHPAPGHSSGTLVNALLYHCGDSLSGIGGQQRPGIVHRLDKDTSGLMLAAKTDRAHQSLSAQLSDRSLSRVYQALLRGTPRQSEGVVDAPIGRHPTDRKKMAVSVKNGRPARTRYQVLESFPGFSLVQCRLETGRTHQIRVHMAHIGHPVAGDTVYGGGSVLGLDSQCLHAKAIRFRHPVSGEEMAFESELPLQFRQVLEKLRAQS